MRAISLTLALMSSLYAYIRRTEKQQVLCMVNTETSAASARMDLPEGMKDLKVLHDLYSGKSIPVEDGAIQVRLQPGEGWILQ